MKGDRASVARGGDGLDLRGPALTGMGLEGIVETAPHPEVATVTAGGDQVHITDGCTSYTEQITHQLIVLADHEGVLGELAQPDGMVQRAHVPLAPERGHLLDDLTQQSRTLLDGQASGPHEATKPGR